ncbi:MAG TPA: gamma-glutamyl-gamma-aminobutyrate hydrolase family protein [Candidatus Hydrogenedentes bacterium]|nr:gamma-glutamyl-gamma-aminobutyrate hydrolase family protein [Candidatus Hydrogenedentota bacterium]HPG67225.1 gamma-glutamyl-gamma-aminobutyrate hydrolase family protein [Candidatus Hydrogenedentota bacterium]
MQYHNSLVGRPPIRSSAFLFVLIGLVWPASAEPPNIGLVYTAEQLGKLEGADGDPLELYTQAIEANGGAVVIIPQTENSEAAQSRLPLLDGVLIPGGIDVDPKFYHETPHEHLEKTDADLDALEFAALAYARARELPVLGICRGHQLLNVYYGGSLVQDIPSQHRSAHLVVHRRPKDSEAGQGTPQHSIAIADGTLLRELLGMDTMMVNTYHHQAVKDLAPGLKASARSEDGIIEAIEAFGPVFMLGVQFHPEKMREDEPRFNAIFVRFIAEAAKAQHRRTALEAQSWSPDAGSDKGVAIPNE